MKKMRLTDLAISQRSPAVISCRHPSLSPRLHLPNLPWTLSLASLLVLLICRFQQASLAIYSHKTSLGRLYHFPVTLNPMFLHSFTRLKQVSLSGSSG